MQKVYDSIIVGAGISGLVLASRLRQKNEKFALLEKSKSVGGRIATRRDGAAIYDHGAQFYKLKHNENFHYDQIWSKEANAKIWFEDDEYFFKVAPEGLTKLAKAISNLEEIQFNEKVVKISDGPLLTLHCESEKILNCRRVFMTAPLPQSLSILDTSAIHYPETLTQIKYASALVGLFEFESQNSHELSFSYCENVTSNIFSISDQKSKGLSTNPAITVVMNATWSQKHFDSDDTTSLSAMTAELESYLTSLNPKHSFKILKAQLKKWRFSHPLSKFEQKYISLGSKNSVFVLGDAFGGASIRGAIDSALALPL